MTPVDDIGPLPPSRNPREVRRKKRPTRDSNREERTKKGHDDPKRSRIDELV